MNRLHPRIKPSAGAGLGKTLIEARLTGDESTTIAALTTFSPEEILSSLWETMVWLTAHTRVHGVIARIDQLHAEATAQLAARGYDLGDSGAWAAEMLETFDEALQHDADAVPIGPRRGLRRPIIGRPIFTTWLAIQEPFGPFANASRPYAGFDGPRGAFNVTIVETGAGMLDGAISAATAVAAALAEDEGVPVPLLLSVVNAVTLLRGARGDYAGT